MSALPPSQLAGKIAISVTIGSLVISENPDEVLVAYGLGSCVAVCLYDTRARVGGMLHALLPSAARVPASNGHGVPPEDTPAKFVDRGVPLLLEGLLARGAKRHQVAAYLCGGAQLLDIPGDDGLSIGERNIAAAEQALAAAGLKIRARATGGAHGRTVRLYIATGEVTLRSLGSPEQVLT